MKLEVVEYETLKPAGPLKVILLQDIEGVGHQFDVVDVDRKLARSNLLPTRKAVYASPFDLEYYAKVKEKMADELAKRIRIPYEYICIGRDLQALVVPIKVSMENKWTLDKNIIKTSLRQAGVDMLDDAIFLDDEVISGPNFEIEARLIRFYVVVCF
ncbi:ribosomal protein L9 domain protein [Ancylostoma caninum]|uniref:Large ribosomal subunit protein bL9m n=1 Tax=Ancylostoma caninum TaxID=29170 RepID=A0A368G055_ANCCA|nr:ribosomal protein L9 domain protein [Ancylostoma caninum]